MELDTDELPFRFDIGEGRAYREWLNKEGFKELFTMEKYPFNWGLLRKIAYRKNYTKEKVSETIGNFIYAFRNTFNQFQNDSDNRSVNCIISKDMDDAINDIWFQIKKRPYNATVIDLALFNGFSTMRTSRIPITPDTALIWSKYLLGEISLKEVQNSIQLKPRRIA